MKITQPLKKPSPHYGMDTSQQPRDENKITHKNSLFLSWCILLALCFAFVSAAPAAAGPNPAKYDKAIRDMGQLQKSKKRLQREPWEKLAETFLTVYRVEKKWKERSAALFRSAEALDHLARCASNTKDARRSVDRYLQLVRLYPKSSLADDSLCAIAEKMLCQLEQRAARSGYQLHHTPRVGQALAAKARSAYGARELRRAVDRAVEQALADQIASGTACVGQHWTADCSADGAIVLREDETATL